MTTPKKPSPQKPPLVSGQAVASLSNGFVLIKTSAHRAIPKSKEPHQLLQKAAKALGTQMSFAQETLAFIDWLRKSPATQDTEGVKLAGEPERAARITRQKNGVVVDDATWQEIVDAGAKVGVTF